MNVSLDRRLLLWLAVPLALLLVWVGAEIGRRPIRRLRKQLALRSPSDLRPVAESSSSRELAPLVATLNRTLGMLRGSIQSQQQFIATTAHRLRTPIAAMLAQIDLLAGEPAAQPIRSRLTALQEGVRELAHTANQLLTLARTDPTVNVAPQRQPVDLAGLAREVLARHAGRAHHSGVELGADLAPARVPGDASLLEDLLDNLVDNALKYTPAGGRVTVAAGRDGERAFVAVEDTGPGIPADERQRVRQRYYRVPDSPGQGGGLGLAIVEEVAKLHDAMLRIDEGARGVGTRISVLFPEAA